MDPRLGPWPAPTAGRARRSRVLALIGVGAVLGLVHAQRVLEIVLGLRALEPLPAGQLGRCEVFAELVAAMLVGVVLHLVARSLVERGLVEGAVFGHGDVAGAVPAVDAPVFSSSGPSLPCVIEGMNALVWKFRVPGLGKLRFSRVKAYVQTPTGERHEPCRLRQRVHPAQEALLDPAR